MCCWQICKVEVTAFKLLAVTTYANGPMAEPWMILGVMVSSVDASTSDHSITVQWEYPVKKSDNQLWTWSERWNSANFSIMVMCRTLSKCVAEVYQDDSDIPVLVSSRFVTVLRKNTIAAGCEPS
jgi:hypothetical protein